MCSASLVIDIGGTNTRVACASGPKVDMASVRRYRNAEMTGLDDVIADYLSATGLRPLAACVAGAGPVRDAELRLTNLDWVVTRDNLMAATGASHVSILNDLQAQGHALGALPEGSAHTLITGQRAASDQAARLVVNVGTGMNVAPVYRLNDQTLVPPSEAGHALLPMETEEVWNLSRFLAERHGFAAIEEALSGRGIEAIYAFVTSKERPAADIMAGVGNDDGTTQTLRLFSRILGHVTGNLTLVHLPFGGVYLVGGVVRHTAPYLMEMGFADAFRSKGRFSTFMDQFPVHVIDDDYAALVGCAAHMAEQMALN